MKVEMKNGDLVFQEVFNPIMLESTNKEEFSICMRDGGFEFTYQGDWYEAKRGVVRLMKKKDDERD